MSDAITVAHSQQYASNVELLLQQKQSRLRTAVRSNSYTGKSAQVVQQVGAVVLQDWVRGADTPMINTPHDVRWLKPKTKHGAQWIDKPDFLRTIANPVSAYAMNGAAAANRVIDQEIIDQFFGTSLSGEDQATSQTWAVWAALSAANTTHIVDSTGAQNMTVSKLRTARKVLLQANVDPDEEMFVVMNASMQDSMLGETLAASLDYNTKPVLVDGRITSFMGFNFIVTELLPSRASSKHSAIAFARSGLAVGIWGDVMGRVDERSDKAFQTQVYTSVTIGATRVEENKCAEIVCAD